MNVYDQATPGSDYIDLRRVVAKRDRIYRAIRDAMAELDADVIKVNTSTNKCACTVTEKIDADAFESDADLVDAVEGWTELYEVAGITDHDLDYLRAVSELVDGIHDDLHVVADDDEPVMIHESHFEQYAEQFAYDVGAIDSNAGWPVCHIDWKAAANSLAQHYTEVTFGGHTYLWRPYWA